MSSAEQKPHSSDVFGVPLSYAVDKIISGKAPEFLKTTPVTFVVILPVHVKFLAHCAALHKYLHAALTMTPRNEQFTLSPKFPLTFLGNLDSILQWSEMKDRDGFLEKLSEEKGADWMKGLRDLAEQLNIKDFENS